MISFFGGYSYATLGYKPSSMHYIPFNGNAACLDRVVYYATLCAVHCSGLLQACGGATAV